MRVNNQNIGNAVQNSELGSSRKAENAAKANDAKKADKAAPQAVDTSGSANIEVSDRAREMSQANDIASSTPDIREAKIAELKRRIAAKQYNVKPEDVADKMVDEHLKTRHIS